MTTKKRTRYLSARKLGISEKARKYLVYAADTLPKLTTPKKLNGGTFGFNMDVVLVANDMRIATGAPPWNDYNNHKCGTAGCILGLIEYKASLDKTRKWFTQKDNVKLQRLFFPVIVSPGGTYRNVTNKIAAKAVKTFLKTGKITFGKLDEVS